MRYLIIEGARQNNLRNISLRLPHNSIIAVTGLSGSGKSSLAFDTIFAEGQWRFIESLSTYARLFLEKLDRPDVDSIRNIRPAIALEQKNPVKGARSTVGTLTEIYDLFRLLYARIARPYCPKCGKEIRRWSVDEIITELLGHYNNERVMITFETSASPEELLKKGFSRIWNGHEIVDLGVQGSGSDVQNPLIHDPQTVTSKLVVVVDRVVIKDSPRLTDSLELAYREGCGRVTLYLFRQGNGALNIMPLRFSAETVCDSCGTKVPEPTPLLFSFNHPVGACPECKGFGNILKYDEALIVPDPSLSITEGAIEPWEKPAAGWWKEQILRGAKKEGIDLHKPFSDLTVEEKEKIFRGSRHFYGIDDFFEDLETKRYKLHVRVFLSRYRSPETCPSCKGKRLRKDSLVYRIAGQDIAGLGEMPIGNLLSFFSSIRLTTHEQDVSREVLRQVRMKLEFLNRVGLDYLTLNRLGKTLSGGEYQRVNLANQIAAYLTGTLYVLDEPTVGLHARDTDRIVNIIREITSLGNTVIVVEHDRKVINSSDWVVELGPGGGRKGGEIVYSGPRDDFLNTDTVTARYLKGLDRERLQTLWKRGAKSLRVKKHFTLKGARGNNLKGIDLKIPLGSFTAVTGVSGSGKSSLIVETLYRALARHFRHSHEHPLPLESINGEEHLKGVRLIDQAPIGKTPRSNPVTYLKVFDYIRKLFAAQPYARAHGYTPGFFSFNVSGGRCERCKGEGFERLEMYFFEDLFVKCEECDGRRYGPEALKITYRGKNIHDVLEMTVDEAVQFFFTEEFIRSKLAIMQEIALGYLRLGQSATTLSGGEAQRLKICAELGSTKKKTGLMYILDEPTVGLHYRDVLALLKVLRRLVDEGNTVVVIEHNLDVVSVADWVIDLGPEGGPEGGNIVFEGPPEKLIFCSDSHTGRYLKEEGYKIETLSQIVYN
ncbi:Excinuclease ABC subunit A [hydrothermal vent metagenome]|uniref:Excinuclease ABC subunit A n=1 Tax=hydrothermal vent metagenome TaxID=652676 RepID=A0A3B1CUP8_9ZZZZ